jgi:asparagine synthase (glutamine-hydrolysing)
MLRTTPESLHETQPVISADGSRVLVWDGRLDNREELLRALDAAGVVPRDVSDAELVLQCHGVWGQECPKHLIGDFAFAVWDQRRQRLFCVRDHLGTRPLYITRTERFVAFASDDEALARMPGVSRALSERHIAYLLVPSYLGFDSSHSWMKDIRHVGPGESTTITADGTESKDIFWELKAGEEVAYASDEECEKAFLRVFAEAVRCRMRSTGVVAVMASGGLDSASTVAMVRRLLPRMPGTTLHTYSAISDDPSTCIESRCILSITEGLGDHAHQVKVPSFSGIVGAEDLAAVGRRHAHPVDNDLLLPAMMCLGASRAGHRVMLTGVCGDLTTQGSYPYISALVKMGRLREAWTECREAATHHTYLQGHSRVAIMARSMYHAFAPVGLKRAVRRFRFDGKSVTNGRFISAALAKRLDLIEWHRAAAMDVHMFDADPKSSHLSALAPPHGIASNMGGYNRVAGKQGIEVRDPWADRRVVEFWLRLPLRFKFRHGWTKYLVRSAMRADLPAEVDWRVGKEHLGWNFFYRLLQETFSYTPATLPDCLIDLGEFVDVSAAGSAYFAYPAAAEHDDRVRVFNLATLVSWAERLRQLR